MYVHMFNRLNLSISKHYICLSILMLNKKIILLLLAVDYYKTALFTTKILLQSKKKLSWVFSIRIFSRKYNRVVLKALITRFVNFITNAILLKTLSLYADFELIRVILFKAIIVFVSFTYLKVFSINNWIFFFCYGSLIIFYIFKTIWSVNNGHYNHQFSNVYYRAAIPCL